VEHQEEQNRIFFVPSCLCGELILDNLSDLMQYDRAEEFPRGVSFL